MNKIFKIILALAALAAVLIITVLAFGPGVYEGVMVKKMAPEEREAYASWKTKRLAIPPEALAVKPFLPETQAAARAFREAIQKQKEKVNSVEAAYFKRNQGDPFQNRRTLDYVALGRDLETLRPVLDAFTALAARPDYEISALAAGQLHDGQGNPPRPEYMTLSHAVHLLLLKALLLEHQGKSAEALATVNTLSTAAQTEAYDILISQMIGEALSKMCLEPWAELIAQTSDPALLRTALERQNRLAEQLARMVANPLPSMTIDNLGQIREIVRRGAPVKLPVNPTRQELTFLTYQAQADYLEQIVLPQVKNDPNFSRTTQARIKDLRNGSVRMGGPGASLLAQFKEREWTPLVSPLLFSAFWPGEVKIRTETRSTLARLEKLRQNTLAKLAVLEKPATPGQASPARGQK